MVTPFTKSENLKLTITLQICCLLNVQKQDLLCFFILLFCVFSPLILVVINSKVAIKPEIYANQPHQVRFIHMSIQSQQVVLVSAPLLSKMETFEHTNCFQP